jgi:inner membrane protein
MDTLTHALTGAVLARATASGTPDPHKLSVRARVLAGAAAAAVPDVDFVLGYVSPVVYLENHRGLTHSILLLPLWALMLAWAFSRIARDPRGPRPWFGVCALGVASHIAGALITSFGTMILAPVSRDRFGIGTTFIIDLWFTGILAAGLVGSLILRRSRVPAVVASLVLVGYVGVQAIQKEEAERFGARYAAEQKIPAATVEAHPRPVSPFNWTVFVSTGERIDFAHVNLRRREAKADPGPDAGFIARLDAPYRPLDDARWQTRTRYGETQQQRALARSAWEASELAFFRWFADLPAYDGTAPGTSCVWFRDLRFETPGRGVTPFRYGVCRDGPDDRWRLHAVSDAGAAQRVER